jgi:hypothetical protein
MKNVEASKSKEGGWIRACLVSVFKHSFLCLNTENGGAGLKFFLFGCCFHFLHSNTVTVELILNSTKMRTTFCCFHLNSAWIRLLFKRPVAILKIPPSPCNGQ